MSLCDTIRMKREVENQNQKTKTNPNDKHKKQSETCWSRNDKSHICCDFNALLIDGVQATSYL